MRIIRFTDAAGNEQLGSQHPDGKVTRLAGELFGELRDTGEPVAVKKLLSPVAPAALLCIGLNYSQHATEGGMAIPKFPMLFMKSSSAVTNPGDPILLPRKLRSEKVDYEAELAVVIGKTFDTFAPLGPCLVTRDNIPNPNALKIRTLLNGQVMQDASTDDMIFDVPSLVEFLSGSTTLHAGTVILTGTPSGVGFARKPPVWLNPGDTVSVEIERIGTLENPVAEEMD